MAERSEGAIAAGFILTIVGFLLILYAVWTSGTIPLNNLTFAGVGVSGIGIAIGAIGLDRGYVKH